MRILIIGGYGCFGRRLSENLLEYHQHELIIAGRAINNAQIFQPHVKKVWANEIRIASIDVLADGLADKLSELKADIVINASGPYQFQNDKPVRSQCNYPVARACLTAGCHYIDLADDRQFVTHFSTNLDDDAKQAGLCMISGASTVPGLSGAVIDHYGSHFKELQEVYFGIAPGNQFKKGKATVGSILTYTGRPFSILKNGRTERVYGWQSLRAYNFGNPIGKRWLGNCQIPDLDLLPERFPTLQTVHFQAGLELRFMHFAMWLIAGLVRIRLIPHPEKFAGFLSSTSEWFDSWGTDTGGMFVQLSGLDQNDDKKTMDWQLLAEKGKGPNIPVIAAELLIDKIAKNQLKAGAYPCIGLFTLAEFQNVAKRWGIVTDVKPSKENPGSKEVEHDKAPA